MTPQKIERKLAAILAADVVGYSGLMSRGEEDTLHRLQEYRAAIDELIAGHRGRIFGSAGDSVIVEFPSSVDALRCAVAIQQALEKRNSELSDSERMYLRIGINVGDIMVEGDNLLGDTVNIAARLEGLAEPGGISISEDVYRYVRKKLKLDFEDLGEQEVKNIPEPIHVYRVVAQGAASRSTHRRRFGGHSRRWVWAAALVILVLAAGLVAVRSFYATGPITFHGIGASRLALPDKPSIAVLPFANLSGDPEQEYFSDGITEDIITELSRFPELFVIARNSVFTYKNRPVKVQQIGRDLGVRYVLEGSVRRSEDRVRINAQLIDAQTGGHLWAERFDRHIEDVFAVQDEVTRRIVAALVGEVTVSELERVRRSDTRNFKAYDYVLRGMDFAFRSNPEDNAKARELYRKAIELDPAYGRAYAHLAWTYLNEWIFGWSEDPQRSLDQAFSIATQAVVLDDTNAYAHGALGSVYLWRKQHDKAIAEWEQAIALNPNAADARAELGDVLTWSGQPEQGLEYVKEAMRLNPKYPFFYDWWALGHAHFVAGQYEQAVAAFTSLRDRNPQFGPSHIYLAASYAQLGRIEEAWQAKAQADRFFPAQSHARVREILPYKDPADLELLFDSLGSIEAAE